MAFQNTFPLPAFIEKIRRTHAPDFINDIVLPTLRVYEEKNIDPYVDPRTIQVALSQIDVADLPKTLANYATCLLGSNGECASQFTAILVARLRDAIRRQDSEKINALLVVLLYTDEYNAYLTHPEPGNGKTILHCIVESNAKPLAYRFINRGANPNIQDHLGNTPLHSAAQANSLYFVLAFLTFGADSRLQNKAGQTALACARDRDVVALLNHANDPTYLLSVAVRGGWIDLARDLISKPVDLSQTFENGNTLLHLAIGNEAMTELLVVNGADLKKKNDEGKTSYDLAQARDLTIQVLLNPEKTGDRYIKMAAHLKSILQAVQSWLPLLPGKGGSNDYDHLNEQLVKDQDEFLQSMNRPTPGPVLFQTLYLLILVKIVDAIQTGFRFRYCSVATSLAYALLMDDPEFKDVLIEKVVSGKENQGQHIYLVLQRSAVKSDLKESIPVTEIGSQYHARGYRLPVIFDPFKQGTLCTLASSKEYEDEVNITLSNREINLKSCDPSLRRSYTSKQAELKKITALLKGQAHNRNQPVAAMKTATVFQTPPPRSFQDLLKLFQFKRDGDRPVTAELALRRAAVGHTITPSEFEILIKNAHINEKTSKKETALILAAREGHADYLRLLLDCGAETHHKDDTMKTAEDYVRDIKKYPDSIERQALLSRFEKSAQPGL